MDGHSGSGGQDWEGSSQFPSIPVKEMTGLPVGRKRLVTEEKTWTVRVWEGSSTNQTEAEGLWHPRLKRGTL